MHKRLIHFLFTNIVFCAALVCVIGVMQTENKLFYQSLYTNTSLLRAGSIFSITMQRGLSAVVLLTIGIASILVALVADEDGFLQNARICFYSASFVIAIWDYRFVFYLSRINGYWWSRIGDISILLIGASVCCSAYYMAYVKCGKAASWFHRGAASFCCLLVCLLRPVHGRKILYVFWSYVILSFLVLIVITIRDGRGKGKNLYGILRKYGIVYLEMIIYILILFTVASQKFNTLHLGNSIYIHMVPIFQLIFAVILFLHYFQLYRLGFLFGPSANRKMEEILRYKEELAQSVISCCYTPLMSLLAYVDSLQLKEEKGEKETEQRRSERLEGYRKIRQELLRLKTYLLSIEEYQYRGSNLHKASFIKVSLSAILQYAIDCSRQEGAGCSFTVFNEAAEDAILGDSYLLIQANQVFFSALADASSNGRVEIHCRREEKQIAVEICTMITEHSVRGMKHLKNLLSSKEVHPWLRRDEDIAALVARENIRHHKTEILSRLQEREHGYYMCISYKLDIYKSEPAIKSILTPEKEKRKKIVLLSTSPEQVELIRNYLEPENFSFRPFHTREEACEYIESKKNIGVVIIGNIFFSSSITDICKRIREIYTMEQLPIIIISKSYYKNFDTQLFSYINDILVEPFEQIELKQKLYSLLLLQKSAQESVKTRLDFLQSQINPHFIFNTLSTIMPLCLQNPQRAYELMNDFSDYLRGRLYQRELQNEIPIDQEMDVVFAYLDIEQVRFPDKIEYKIVTDYADDRRMIPLLLEPIVENSAQHGRKTDEVLHILIEILEEDNYIYFRVLDDGVGMSEETVALISGEYATTGDSIGISNVRKRLMLYYNERLKIESKLGEGTEISFRIPVKESLYSDHAGG